MHMYRSKSRTAFANEDELSPPRLVTYVKFVDNEMCSHLYRGRWLGLPWLLNDVISDFTSNDADRRGEWAPSCFVGASRSLERRRGEIASKKDLDHTSERFASKRSVSPKDLWEIQIVLYCRRYYDHNMELREIGHIFFEPHEGILIGFSVGRY